MMLSQLAIQVEGENEFWLLPPAIYKHFFELDLSVKGEAIGLLDKNNRLY